MAAFDPTAMRRLNGALTLRALADAGGSVTITQLVERTALSRRTTHLILETLVDEGWIDVVTLEPGAAGVGRPPRLFRFRPENALIVGARISTAAAEAIVTDVTGTVLSRARGALEDEADAAEIVRRTIAVVEQAIADCPAPADRIRALTIATGGTVDADGRILSLPQQPKWTSFDLRSPFAERFPFPVFVENDTNVAALAERWRGVAAGVDTFIWYVAGNRSGAGIVIHDRLLRGVNGAAGEIVHADPLGIAALREHPAALISSPFPDRQRTARELYERAAAGDPDSVRIVEEFVGPVTRVIVTLAWTIAPPLIVLAGLLAGTPAQYLLERIEAALADYDVPAFRLRVSALGDDAFLLGGVRYALDELDADIFGPLAG
jgi:predicted NBD/HSP70 family sugar kinase